MIDPEKVMKRCQIGARNLNEANNLLAECYGVIGRLLQEKAFADFRLKQLPDHAIKEVQRLGQEIEQKIGCVNHDCDQCKAQPEQEPVIGKWSLREVYFDEDGEPISHRSPPQRTEQPAQRTWVGLTEQDLDYLCNLAYTGDEEFALAVQAKLMEKNA